MSSAFYCRFSSENAGITSKICRAYTDRTHDDYHGYWEKVCLQLWKTYVSFQHKSAVYGCTGWP